MKEYASDDIIAARINSDRFAMLIPKKSFSVDMILSIIHRMQDYLKIVHSICTFYRCV